MVKTVLESYKSNLQSLYDGLFDNFLTILEAYVMCVCVCVCRAHGELRIVHFGLPG